MKLSLLISILNVAMICTISLAQTRESRPPVSSSQIVDVILRPVVSNDLELLDSQVKDIQMLRAGHSGFLSSAILEMKRGDEKARREIVTSIRAEEAVYMEKVYAVLLPDQVKRLQQIVAQYLVSRVSGDSSGLLHKWTKERLGISDAQAAKIKEDAAVVGADLSKELARLKAEMFQTRLKARNELLTSLTPQQRQKYEELFGKPIDLQSERQSMHPKLPVDR